MSSCRRGGHTTQHEIQASLLSNSRGQAWKRLSVPLPPPVLHYQRQRPLAPKPGPLKEGAPTLGRRHHVDPRLLPLGMTNSWAPRTSPQQYSESQAVPGCPGTATHLTDEEQSSMKPKHCRRAPGSLQQGRTRIGILWLRESTPFLPVDTQMPQSLTRTQVPFT